MENLNAGVQLKKKFINEVILFYKKMTRGYYTEPTFLINESNLLKILDDYPNLDDSLKYIINYYLTRKWETT